MAMSSEGTAENRSVRRPLFRLESLQERAHAWQGRPSVALGMPATFTTLASIVLAAGIGALIAFGSYARRVDLHGAILPASGLISISAPASGWIESLAVKEGASVEQGAPLYTLDVDIATKSGDVQQMISNVLLSERKVLSDEIDRIVTVSRHTQSYLQQRVDNLHAQIQQLDKQIETRKQFSKALNDEYNASVDMLKKGEIARNELDIRQQAWMRSKTEVETIEGNKIQLTGDLDDAEYKLATIDSETSNQIDGFKAKIAEIDEKRAAGEAHGSIVIRAPASGVIADIVGKPGQVLEAGSTMLTIVPAQAQMRAVLLAPSSAIGFVHNGQRVLMLYSAFPYQKFGEQSGTVVSIAQVAVDPDQTKALLAGSPLDKTATYYRVVVEPDKQFVDVAGEPHALPANMRVEAYALLDRRPLYRWILQPLDAFGRAAHQG
jgi:membrane fusion protein